MCQVKKKKFFGQLLLLFPWNVMGLRVPTGLRPSTHTHYQAQYPILTYFPTAIYIFITIVNFCSFWRKA
jgi:hypothetical protein